MSKILFAALAVALTAAQASHAAPFRMLLESDTDREGGSEVFGLSYESAADVLNHNADLDGFGGLNIGPRFDIAGLTHDGEAYHMIVERDTDAEAGAEVAFASFETYDDLLAGNVMVQGFTDLDIGTNFSIGGLAYDGQFRLLVESNDDRLGGSEVVIATFDTFADLQDSQISAQGFSQLDIGAGFSVGGFAYDGSYSMVLESNEDRADNEVFMLGFDTLDDLIDGNFVGGSSGFTPLNVGPNFSISGLAYERQLVDPAPVPLPAGLPLLGLGCAAFATMRWRRRAYIAPS